MVALPELPLDSNITPLKHLLETYYVVMGTGECLWTSSHWKIEPDTVPAAPERDSSSAPWGGADSPDPN
eukprot:4585098-Prymnesium_polylepis.1